VTPQRTIEVHDGWARCLWCAREWTWNDDAREAWVLRLVDRHAHDCFTQPPPPGRPPHTPQRPCAPRTAVASTNPTFHPTPAAQAVTVAYSAPNTNGGPLPDADDHQ